MCEFIGVVDLTVRLSSMNPFGHIDVQEANRRFESAIIYSCQTLYNEAGKDTPLAKRYEAKGIIPYGASDKYFHFDDREHIVHFARTLRSRLISQGLPFKICISKGDLARGNLLEKLGALKVGVKSGDAALRQAATAELQEIFNTTDLAEIARLLELYRAPSASESSVMLSTRLEAFKGFGIWIDQSVLESGIEDAFKNYFPTRGPNGRYTEEEFLDCLFPRLDADVVIRFAPDTEDAPDLDSSWPKRKGKRSAPARPDDADLFILPTGRAPLIDNVLDLLRRSSKAGEDNSIYYVSLLTTIVRSSNFCEIARLAASEPWKENPAKLLAPGWQHYPPIFNTLVLDQHHRGVIRKIPGIQLTLAALIDEIHAALTGEPTSAELPAAPASKRSEATRAKIAAAAEKDGIFGQIVRHIEATFGVPMMRKIWAVPNQVMNQERKRTMLNVMTSK